LWCLGFPLAGFSWLPKVSCPPCTQLECTSIPAGVVACRCRPVRVVRPSAACSGTQGYGSFQIGRPNAARVLARMRHCLIFLSQFTRRSSRFHLLSMSCSSHCLPGWNSSPPPPSSLQNVFGAAPPTPPTALRSLAAAAAPSSLRRPTTSSPTAKPVTSTTYIVGRNKSHKSPKP
jgi:hypothetical protein